MADTPAIESLRHGRHTGRPYDPIRTAFLTVGADAHIGPNRTPQSLPLEGKVAERQRGRMRCNRTFVPLRRAGACPPPPTRFHLCTINAPAIQSVRHGRIKSAPTTAYADAVSCVPALAPSDEGAGFCETKDWGRESVSFCFSPSVFACGESTSLVRGRQGLRHGRHTGRPYKHKRTAPRATHRSPLQSQTHCVTGRRGRRPLHPCTHCVHHRGVPVFWEKGGFVRRMENITCNCCGGCVMIEKKCANRCGRSCQLCFGVR